MNHSSLRAIVVAVALLVCVSLASFTLMAEPPKTLYERLGGKPANAAVVDELVARVAADKRINGFFAGVASDPARLAAFKGKLTPYRTSKGTLRFPLAEPVPVKLIRVR